DVEEDVGTGGCGLGAADVELGGVIAGTTLEEGEVSAKSVGFAAGGSWRDEVIDKLEVLPGDPLCAGVVEEAIVERVRDDFGEPAVFAAIHEESAAAAPVGGEVIKGLFDAEVFDAGELDAGIIDVDDGGRGSCAGGVLGFDGIDEGDVD